MAERVIRSTRHPKPKKLPDTLERLRAQAKERKTTDPVQDWLERTSSPPSKAYTFPQPAYNHARKPSNLPPPSHSVRQLHLRSKIVDASPLQPTHGNQLPHPYPPPPTHAPPTYPSRKRIMPDDFDANPRQSAPTKKKIQSTAQDDGTMVKGKEGVATRASQGQRKVGSKKKEVDVFDVPGDRLEDGGRSRIRDSLGSKRREAKEERLSNQSSHVKGLVTHLMSSSSTPLKTPSPQSKGSGSSSKGLINVNKRERMIFMEPRIEFQTLIDTKNSGTLTGKLQKLWRHGNWYEPKVIPSAFKTEINQEIDTPNKTKPRISDEYFGTLQDQYAADDYTLMRLTVADVLDSADQYRHSSCTEAQWTSIVVSPLLNLMRRLKRYQSKDSKLAVLDLTSVDLSPSSLCPTYCDSLFKDLDKRIDAAIGLHLPSKKRDTIMTAVYSEGIPSINQTASFVNFIPMFANVVIKRPNTNKDPLIQLGTWIAAEFKKRKKEGYSLDMPVLAITIEGDVWDLHMVFAPEDVESSTFECKFVGPIEMGTTKSLLGVYQILDRLCSCADWGIGEYQTWFNEQVLAKYEK